MKVDKCRLCLQKRKLCKSHIIPEFAYKEMYDSNHKLRFIRPNHPYNFIGRKPKGIYEPLLCNDCEHHLKVFEDYAYGSLSNCLGFSVPATGNHSKMPIVSRKFDYSKVKLFILSVLWRMSISSKNFFARISLGNHENILRQYIQNSTAPEFTEYPMTLSVVTINNQYSADWIVEPDTITHNGQPVYRFVIKGLLFIIAPNGSAFGEQKMKNYALQANGTWNIPIVDANNLPFLSDWITKNRDTMIKNHPRI